MLETNVGEDMKNCCWIKKSGQSGRRLDINAKGVLALVKDMFQVITCGVARASQSV